MVDDNYDFLLLVSNLTSSLLLMCSIISLICLVIVTLASVSIFCKIFSHEIADLWIGVYSL